MQLIIRIFAVSLLAFTAFVSEAPAEVAEAIIQGTEEGSPLIGTALLMDTEDGLDIMVSIQGAPPGVHGIHIHENGSCEDGGKAAGGHFNPSENPHGSIRAHGLSRVHSGDLGNITVDETGSGTLQLTLEGLSLTDEIHGVNDRAIILHAKADDFSQPTGNAGGRIGCGIITLLEGSGSE